MHPDCMIVLKSMYMYCIVCTYANYTWNVMLTCDLCLNMWQVCVYVHAYLAIYTLVEMHLGGL